MIGAFLTVLALTVAGDLPPGAVPSAPPPAQQAARDTRVTVTVVDQTGAVLPNAVVTIVQLGDAKTPIAPGKTNDKGIAVLSAPAPGRYSIQAEFPGFEPRLLKDIQLRPGDNKHVVVLSLQGLQDSVTVGRDAREAASDRRSTFGTALTREQIEALSDDPDEMAQQLQDLAGGGAIIRVDSFEGGRLPPKAQIKSIHITRDAFAAENHSAGSLFIDIITQPGIGPLRTNINTRLRAGKLSGDPPEQFSTEKGPERFQSYNGGIGGSVIKQRASFSINVQSNDNFDTPYFHYYTPDRELVTGLAPRHNADNVFVFGLFDYALTKDQTLRVNYTQGRFTDRNGGVGQLDLLERAFDTESNNHSLRIQEAGPIGRRFFINTRTSINWSNTSYDSAFEAPTVRVIDGFTSGGQQRAGGVRSKTINLQSDLDYVRGIHSFRTGLALDGGSFHSDDSSNYLGTYTFESLGAFNLGIARSFTIRTGDPNIQYWNLQAGVYAQDDIRVRKNLTLSPGVRYELQTHLSDYNNVGPRFGVTWSPGKSGKTTLRGSAGIFYDWLSTGIYEQTLRVDGIRQRQLNIQNPTYPTIDISAGGTTAPTDKYLLSDELPMQRNTRFSAGIDRTLSRMVRVNATYAHTRGQNLMRGFNQNAPVGGVRPDAEFVNVVEVLGDAKSRTDSLNVGASINFNVASSGPMLMNGGDRMMVFVAAGGPPPPPPGGAGANPANKRWNWRRMSVFTNVSFANAKNDTEGAFAMPATGNIADDWGPSNNDVHRRLNVGWSSQQLRNLNANINFNIASAPPYTIRTGFDTNGDLVFNDRPAGVGRNTARADGQWTLNGFFGYGWQFGKPMAVGGPIAIRSEGGAATVSQGAGQSVGRYRLNLNVNLQNITNQANLVGFVGTLTAPNFGQATQVLGTRKVEISLGLTF